MKEDGVFGTKIKCIDKYWRGTMATVIIVSNLAKEAGDLISACRVYSNGRSRKNKCDCDVPVTICRVHI